MATKTTKSSVKTNNAFNTFAVIRAEMKSALIERDVEIDLLLAALLSEQSLLLVGPPGTGKSLLLNGLMDRMADCKTFTYLMTKHTTPDEVFGPVSPGGLIDDRFVRITKGRLPEAHAAFLDEIWKASSAILNGLLTILLERQFDNDGERRKVPLRLAVAASNEWPNGEELGAAFDRFLIRKTVQPVRSKAGLTRLLSPTGRFNPSAGRTFTIAELNSAIAAVNALPFHADAESKLLEIVEALHAAGINIASASRRLRLGSRIAQAMAYLNGHAEVEIGDLEILGHVWWIDPAQADKAIETVARIANPTGATIISLLNQVDDVVAATAGAPTGAIIEAIDKIKKVRDGDGTGRPCLKALDQSHPGVVDARQYVADTLRRLNGLIVGLDEAA